MINIYSINERQEWDVIVRSFQNYDVYYLSGYVRAFQIHGDGEPHLLYYENDGCRAIYVFMKRITLVPDLYDSITPYGYGGVLFDKEPSLESLRTFWNEYLRKMQELHIVDNFVRYHPILRNAALMKKISFVIDLGKTIALDLSSPEVIWNNIISKNRNMIRKAEKSGIEIHHSHEYSLFKTFMEIYDATMKKDHAEQYYFFGMEFYDSIYNDLDGNYEIFYATYEGKIISISIMLYANNSMHYHLSGSLIEYRNLAPSNLLLYKAALWGCEMGFKTFNLGGGIGSSEDNLYKFKAAFNRNSDYQFSIGKEVYNEELYNLLVNEKFKDNESRPDSSFFPLYRVL